MQILCVWPMEMKFALIPRGGGSGMTGGAVPARRRAVVVGLTRLTNIGPVDLENMTVTAEGGRTNPPNR